MPFLSSVEEDVVGSDNIRRAMIELFYELHKHQEANGGSLLKKRQASPALRDKQTLGVIAPIVDADSENLL